jgi:hypothetical protein
MVVIPMQKAPVTVMFGTSQLTMPTLGSIVSGSGASTTNRGVLLGVYDPEEPVPL